jgi:cell division protein FtsX
MTKFFRTLNRSIKSGFTKFGRMYYVSLPLSLFFTLIITLCGLLSFTFAFSNHLTETVTAKINIVTYFNKGTSDALALEISNKIKERSDVKKIDFIDKAMALQTFKERRVNDSVSMQALSEIGVNPFGASVVVYANDTRQYELLAKEIVNIGDSYKGKNEISPIETVNYTENKLVIERLANMLRKGESALFVLVIVLLVILLLVLYLALRLATQGDREEIKVMKLVGAPILLIMGPAAVMGALSGLLGGFISLFILYFIAQKASVYTMAFDNFNLLFFYTNHVNTFIIYIFVFGIVFGFIGSMLAVRRHM